MTIAEAKVKHDRSDVLDRLLKHIRRFRAYLRESDSPVLTR